MRFEEYERRYAASYAEFAETIRIILGKTIDASPPTLPRPQFIQARAKAPDKLKRRLDEAGQLDTDRLEEHRKDLAGVRLIFYTNNDVERFLASRLVFDNFEIEHDATKLHIPTPDNPDAKYRAIHYIVRLRDDRTRLPEYAKFRGLRCEIQIQTILNHAWSETSHDIVYKGRGEPGFGSRAMDGIKKRFDGIMDKYLLPAGYEIQKAQNEYEQLLQGKELFDKDVVKLLAEARDNNERYQLLTALRDYAIPNYDDHSVAFDTLRWPLIETARAARRSEPVTIESAFGAWRGYDVSDVLKVIVEILSLLRYVNVNESLTALADLFREEDNTEARKQILEAVRGLAEYDLRAWKQVGPRIQLALVEQLAEMSPAEITATQPIAVVVWREALSSDIGGTTWKADSVTISTGAVPVSEALRIIRTRALDGLFACFGRASTDKEKSEIMSAMDAATRVPTQAQYSDELLNLTLQDATRIVEFMTRCVDGLSFEIRQHYEHELLYEYRRVRSLLQGHADKPETQTLAAKLASAIEVFRNCINRDQSFVRYKVLVGFKSVFPQHWEDNEFDFRGADAHRKEQADKFIDEIAPENEEAWFAFIERCAATKSQDLATFPVFGQFLVDLSRRRPDIANRCLARGNENLLGFLSAFLDGLSQSTADEVYARNLEKQLELGTHLASLARHLRNINTANPALAGRVLAKATSVADDIAVMESLILVMEKYGAGAIDNEEELFRSALKYLSQKRDARWVRGAWFQSKTSQFFSTLSEENARLLLGNLVFLPRFDYPLERILRQVADSHPALVWEFFERRLNHDKDDVEDERYENAPLAFHELHKALARDPALAITAGRQWFARDSGLFRFKGGRLLSSVFPKCPTPFAEALADLVKNGSESDVELVLGVVQNYEGEESTHEVLKRVVARFPHDKHKLSMVGICFDNTGVVSGQFGMVEALRAKRTLLKSWLSDERTEVQKFAADHVHDLEQWIAAEQLRAERGSEMRKLTYPEDDDGDPKVSE
ncbi:MAG TPA: RelA/SpoT domain-containing protein [Stellaceae bacterium]|nr:RelA/SpoT domain-containing protein [Stellaceae bacterium]